jgi:hypothetical protein
VVVNDLYVGCVVAGPSKAQPPLVVDPDAVLTRTFALQRLKPVSGQSPQEFKAGRSIQHGKLAPSRRLDPAPAPHRPTFEQGLGIPATETQDRHGLSCIDKRSDASELLAGVDVRLSGRTTRVPDGSHRIRIHLPGADADHLVE